MAIIIDQEQKLITLHTKNTTYQMGVGNYGQLLHLYYGKRLTGDMRYKLEHLPWKYNETPSIEQLIRVLEEGKLIGAIIKLKKREQEILIARVFEELDFKEIGTRMEMSEKQAEMAYYYVIRKIRKELEGKRYE